MLRSANEADFADDGIVARAVDRAFENPAMSGGLLVMVLTAAAIASNALFLQTGGHPRPLLATRPPVGPAAPMPVVPLPRSRAEFAIVPPTPSRAPAMPVAGGQQAGLVADVQRELARLGLYTGTIDGIAGSHTEAAVAAYETAAGLAVTGAPSAALLDFMRNPSAADAHTIAPLPAALRRDAEDTIAKPRRATVSQEEVCRRIQSALNQIGYGPIGVDGRPGAETTNAIRRFELDNGLPITGEVGDRVVRRLVAIGAMKAL